MPSIVSDPGGGESGHVGKGAGRYRFSYSAEGPYGRAAGLVERLAPAGLVLDLGCGYAAIAEALRAQGREYVGVDRDSDPVADLRSRGFEAHLLDLAVPDGLGDTLADLTGQRPVGAVLLLDIIEHLAEPSAFLEEVASFARRVAPNGRQPLVVASIPNVAHFDLAAKLLAGRFDMTETGLLDRTHLQFFTEDRMNRDLAESGWVECGRDDVLLEHSDQWFPLDHPFLVEGGAVHDHLRTLRSAADPNLSVNQYVRAFELRPVAPAPEDALDDSAGALAAARPCDLSVLVRTQGLRNAMLEEALTCLAAQTVETLEVIVLVHNDDEVACKAVADTVQSFDPSFADRVTVLPVSGGGRAAPLNRGLEACCGRYVAFLDDDDLVTADWAEAFLAAVERAPGKVVRSVSCSRYVRRAEPAESAMGAVPVTLTRPTREFARSFDLLTHLVANQTPVSSFAIPRALHAELGLSFDETLPVCEDWEMLVRAALVVGVEDTGRITSIYQRWEDAGTTAPAPSTEVWPEAHHTMIRALDGAPLLLPAGTASVLARLIGDKYETGSWEVETARGRGPEDAEIDRLHQQVEELESRARAAEQARDELLDSEFWRLTAPARAIVTRLRARWESRPPTGRPGADPGTGHAP